MAEQFFSRIGGASASKRVKINVGGRIFETTMGTLLLAGESSTLVKVVFKNLPEPFFDRDPEPFAILLSMLRTGKVDNEYSEAFPISKLIREARYYGLVDQLRTSLAPDPLDGMEAVKHKTLTPNSVGDLYSSPLATAPGSDGSVWVGHGPRITVYDWALQTGKSTVTELPRVEILERISDNHVMTGDSNFPGLKIYNVMEGTHTNSLKWENNNWIPGVQAITSNDTHIFATRWVTLTDFKYSETLHSRLLLIDRTRMEIQSELRAQSTWKDFLTLQRTKFSVQLQWLPQKKLLLEGTSCEDSPGQITLWDVRSEKYVWQWEGCAYEDMIANEELAAIFKLNDAGTELKMCDMRNLNAEAPWLTLGRALGSNGVRSTHRLETQNRQLFVSNGNTLEVLSKIPLTENFKVLPGKKLTERSFTNIVVGCPKVHSDDLVISHLAVGGNRLFVSRKSHVEVWESRRGV